MRNISPAKKRMTPTMLDSSCDNSWGSWIIPIGVGYSSLQLGQFIIVIEVDYGKFSPLQLGQFRQFTVGVASRLYSS